MIQISAAVSPPLCHFPMRRKEDELHLLQLFHKLGHFSVPGTENAGKAKHSCPLGVGLLKGARQLETIAVAMFPAPLEQRPAAGDHFRAVCRGPTSLALTGRQGDCFCGRPSPVCPPGCDLDLVGWLHLQDCQGSHCFRLGGGTASSTTITQGCFSAIAQA